MPPQVPDWPSEFGHFVILVEGNYQTGYFKLVLAKLIAMKRVNATSAKNRFGEILRMAETEPVYIVKHGKPKTVVIDAALYEALKQGLRHPDDEAVAALRDEFNEMVAQMQKPRWHKGVERVVSASSEDLNRIAARRIRVRARKHR